MKTISEKIKDEARRLSEDHKKSTGQKLLHGHALDLVSRKYGFKNWNVLIAKLKGKLK